MREWIQELLLENWQRKGLSLFAAIIIYILVNSSITTTKTINNVPVRINGLQRDMTVEGLLPNGYLANRITLTLKGTKTVLDELNAHNLEVVLDAGDVDEQWIAHIGRENLQARNSEIDMWNNITDVSHNEFVLKLSRLITAKVPISIAPPFGEPPKGYQYLDVWPQRLYHTISGPEEDIEDLQAQGLRLQFDLSRISREELDALQTAGQGFFDDEVYFFVPSKVKRIAIPFHNNALEEINDADARNLRIEFLRKASLPLHQQIPVLVFFPDRYSETLNPDTYSLLPNNYVAKKNGVLRLTVPLYVRNVSRKFLDVVRDHLQLTVIAAPKISRERLKWSIQFIDPKSLENRYVAALMRGTDEEPTEPDDMRENYLRNRFREYMRIMELTKENDVKLNLDIQLEGSHVVILDSDASRDFPQP